MKLYLIILCLISLSSFAKEKVHHLRFGDNETYDQPAFNKHIFTCKGYGDNRTEWGVEFPRKERIVSLRQEGAALLDPTLFLLDEGEFVVFKVRGYINATINCKKGNSEIRKSYRSSSAVRSSQTSHWECSSSYLSSTFRTSSCQKRDAYNSAIDKCGAGRGSMEANSCALRIKCYRYAGGDCGSASYYQ